MDRQDLKILMNSIGLNHMIPKVHDLATLTETDELDVLRRMIVMGCHSEGARLTFDAEEIKQRKKEKNQKKERNNIYIIKEKTLKELKDSSTIQEEKLGPPFEIKRQMAAKKKKIDRKTSMPKSWVDAREKETLDDQVLILYAEGQGYDWYGAKDLFLAFVDHHMSKGTKFVKWESAFYTWIRNDIKWKGKPVPNSCGSMVQSYENKNPIGELFND